MPIVTSCEAVVMCRYLDVPPYSVNSDVILLYLSFRKLQ